MPPQNFILSLIDAFVMVMPAIGYVDTNRIMCATKSSAAYNFETVLILLSSQYLKVIYFVYHPYAIRIFGQSISQLLIALSLTFFKHRYKDPKQVRAMPYWKRILTMDSAKNYREFLVSLGFYYAAAFAVFQLAARVIGRNTAAEATGLIANIIESMVSLPIFADVVIHKVVKNVSFVLILQYLFGDMVKIALFILSKTPWFFVAGGCFQLFVDTILFAVYCRLSFCSKKRVVDEEKLISDEEEDESEAGNGYRLSKTKRDNHFNADSSENDNILNSDEKFEYNSDL